MGAIGETNEQARSFAVAAMIWNLTYVLIAGLLFQWKEDSLYQTGLTRLSMQVPVHVRNQIKSLELLGYQNDRRRIPLKEINSTSKQQHEARKATAGAAWSERLYTDQNDFPFQHLLVMQEVRFVTWFWHTACCVILRLRDWFLLLRSQSYVNLPSHVCRRLGILFLIYSSKKKALHAREFL